MPVKTFSTKVCNVLDEIVDFYEEQINKELPDKLTPNTRVDFIAFKVSEAYRKLKELDDIKNYFLCKNE